MFGGSLRCRAHREPRSPGTDCRPAVRTLQTSDLTDFGAPELTISAKIGPGRIQLPCPTGPGGGWARVRTGRDDRAGDPPLVAPDGRLTDFGPYRLRCSVTAPTFRSSGSGRPSGSGLQRSQPGRAAARCSATPEPARGRGLAGKASYTSGTSELTDFRSSGCLAAPIHHESGKVPHGTSELPMFVTPELPNNEARRFHPPRPTAERSTRSPMPPVIRTPTGVAFRRTDGSASAKGRPPT